MCIFRKATEKDYEGICNLIKSKEELFLVYPSGNYPFTIEQVKELNKIRKELTVIEENNIIIGFANFYNVEERKSAFIGNVVIDKNHRGRGLGKLLISTMLELAKEKYNLLEIKISVFNTNTPAMLLYLGFGFIPYNSEEKKDSKSNRVVLIHLKKGLN